jgi:hypothetical protein
METAELTPGVERIARVIARTHLATGAPLTNHTPPGHHSEHWYHSGARRARRPAGGASYRG